VLGWRRVLQHLDIVDLEASYGGLRVLNGVTLGVPRGKTLGLIGPSGSGKSTLLRVLIGLLPPSGGRVLIDGAPVAFKDRRQLRMLRDRLAIVFQQYNLFQNMTVLGNVTVAPVKVKGRPRAEVEREAEALLAKVGLASKLHAYPDELSGGQQQRVAIARALALHPEILLLDEVTSALDPELVGEVLDTIRALAGDGMTMVIVSHEMAFIREVASEAVLMADGKVVESGRPADILDRPREARTREFVSRILRH
jgi:polar amino acid transport system ATP-binding protein